MRQLQAQRNNLLCLFLYQPPLPLPLGEVAERSEDGEGKWGCNALSVTFGDSSPQRGSQGGVPIRSIPCFTTARQKNGTDFVMLRQRKQEKYGADCSFRQKFRKLKNNTLQL